jgi:hypothetical protein
MEYAAARSWFFLKRLERRAHRHQNHIDYDIELYRWTGSIELYHRLGDSAAPLSRCWFPLIIRCQWMAVHLWPGCLAPPGGIAQQFRHWPNTPSTVFILPVEGVNSFGYTTTVTAC